MTEFKLPLLLKISSSTRIKALNPEELLYAKCLKNQSHLYVKNRTHNKFKKILRSNAINF